jgi:glyoxylase-like metal-dependent hydrolase (beta-lactamase superfamily II)
MAALEAFTWPPAACKAVPITDTAVHLLAPNSNEWTYEGTNTWVLGAPGGTQCLVVDPGTRAEAHLEAITRTAASRGWRIAGILVTHNHADHAPGAAELRDRTGAPVYANHPQVADAVVGEGDRIRADGLEVEVLHTRGHSDDSLTFWLPEQRTMLTGDTILGRRSSAVFGRLDDFFRSAARLGDLAARHDTVLLPGHGTPLADAGPVIERAIEVHRQRMRDVARLLDTGVTDVAALTDLIYPNIPALRRPAAEFSVRATRDLLVQERHACGERAHSPLPNS